MAYRWWNDLLPLACSRKRQRSKLRRPHFVFRRTAGRSLGGFTEHTGNGGRMEITISSKLVTEPDPDLIRELWPASGLQRFVENLVYRFSLQCILHQLHDRVTPSLFRDEANR